MASSTFNVNTTKENAFDAPQQEIALNAGKVIAYLKLITALKPNIGHHYVGGGGRPFTRDIKSQDENNDVITISLNDFKAIFENKKLVDEYEKLLLKFGDAPATIELLQELEKFIEYVFRPIEQSKEWNEFWKTQSALIESDITLNNVKASVRNRIASSFIFGLQAALASKNFTLMREYKDKVSIFSKYLNKIGEARNSENNAIYNEHIAEQNKLNKTDLTNKLDRFKTALYTQISQRELKPKQISKFLDETLQAIRQGTYFKTLVNNEAILQDLLLQVLKEVKEYKLTNADEKHSGFFKKQNECVKQLAKAIEKPKIEEAKQKRKQEKEQQKKQPKTEKEQQKKQAKEQTKQKKQQPIKESKQEIKEKEIKETVEKPELKRVFSDPRIGTVKINPQQKLAFYKSSLFSKSASSAQSSSSSSNLDTIAQMRLNQQKKAEEGKKPEVNESSSNNKGMK